VLKSLETTGISSGRNFDLDFGSRLNVLTGDNGLGKSFVLELIWWSITGDWTERPVIGDKGSFHNAKITSRFSHNELTDDSTSTFNPRKSRWRFSRRSALKPSLVIYATASGSFHIWDRLRNIQPDAHSHGMVLDGPPMEAVPYRLEPEALWNGLSIDGKKKCKGLVEDLVDWQTQSSPVKTAAYELFNKVLSVVSNPLEPLVLSKPRRLYLDDIREFPVIKFSYEETPVEHCSSGVKRILGLAYSIVWAWIEHLAAAELTNEKPGDEILFLIDEPESHLHPSWQRSIIPSLLNNLTKSLVPSPAIQWVMTTHSPLVLTSIEPFFQTESDRLFCFQTGKDSVEVTQEEWSLNGDTIGWLTSDIFGLNSTRSKEAEILITEASALMEANSENSVLDEIEKQLTKLISNFDPFWSQWRFYREQQKLKLIVFSGGELADQACKIAYELPHQLSFQLLNAQNLWSTYVRSPLQETNSILYVHSGTGSVLPTGSAFYMATVRGNKLVTIQPNV